MGCNCGKKNRQARMQRQVQKAKQSSGSPGQLTAKQYLDHLKSQQNKK